MTIGEALLGEGYCRHITSRLTEDGVRCYACGERVPSKRYWEPIGMPHRHREVADAICAGIEMHPNRRPFFIYQVVETDDGRWQVERGFR